MMKKKIESPFRKLKILVVLPLAAMIFYAFAVPDYQYGDDNYVKATDGKVINVEGQALKSDVKPLYGNPVILKGTTNGTIANPKGKKGMKVKGQVLKSDGSPLYGTSVILRGCTVGAITDKKGNFVLKGIPEDGELVFSFIGFKTVVQKISNQPMKIVMEGSKVGIEGVVVRGYANGTQSPPPILDLAKWAQNENPPLIYVDGKIITMAEMVNINRDQIKSVSVLKDKSAIEVYGEKAKNGVILIKTKAKTDLSAGTGIDYSAPKEKQVFVVVEEMPEFPGGEKALRDFIGSNVKYPDDAKKEGIQGLVFITFVVKSDGNVENAKVVRGVHPLLDKEALRVISMLPAWKPGKQRGHAVNVAYTIPVQFTLDGDKMAKQEAVAVTKVPTQRPDGVYIVVEEMPEFPGGLMALREFITSTVKYPADAIKEGILGKVYVNFTVKPDGTVADAKIARGVHPLLDDEAIRVVNSMPAWKPGKQGGEAVSVTYIVPVQFALKNSATQQNPSLALPKDPTKTGKQVFVVVEEMPEFPGGESALKMFLGRTIIYPVVALEARVQGNVLVSFVINAEGKVEQAKVIRKVHPALDAEALRVVGMLPDWKPGKQRGTAVSVEYTIPIEFKLQ